jgi:hypothetical protein
MDLNGFEESLTLAGQEAILAAVELQPREKEFLQHFQQLCKDFPRELARSALETAILRGGASKKYPRLIKSFSHVIPWNKPPTLRLQAIGQNATKGLHR